MMQFHEYTLSKSQSNSKDARDLSIRDYYIKQVAEAMEEQRATGMWDERSALLTAEFCWCKNRRPFYNVYPAVVRCLQNTSLRIKPTQLKQVESTAICFAVGHEPRFISKVPAVVFSLHHRYQHGVFKVVENPLVTMLISRITDDGQIKYSFLSIEGDEYIDATAGKYICKSGEDVEADVKRLLSICVGTAMLASDERFAEPMLLNRDRGRELTAEQRAAAVERAKRNGRNGVEIGKHLEASPHIRRPHFGIRWTSKGRSVPKLVPVKGCLVSKSKLYPIPTGYLGNDDERNLSESHNDET